MRTYHRGCYFNPRGIRRMYMPLHLVLRIKPKTFPWGEKHYEKTVRFIIGLGHGHRDIRAA